MSFEIITIPCLKDNYAFVIANSDTGEAILIDAPEAGPINAALAARDDLTLTTVLITHHHWDHVDGLPGLDGVSDLHIVGCGADAGRLPKLDQTVAAGETISVCGLEVEVIAADGHTMNHIAFHMPALSALFTGDSLMTHGCGRLFEGTPDDMFATVQRFAKLPDHTRTYCGHDYAGPNLTFAKQFAPDADALQQREADLNRADAAQESTTGVTLALEKQLNPYLRVHLPQVKASVGMENASDAAVFAEIRTQKDQF